jgi:hypothetical protein
MPLSFFIGLTGAIILVLGSAYPAKQVNHPTQSLKNWLFAIGGAFMFTYSLMNYLSGGSIFFVFLQILVNAAGILMLADVKKSISTPLILGGGMILVTWSLRLFEDPTTLLFIGGLVSISMGYLWNVTSQKRYIALTLGSALVSVFSYLQGDMIFFWLNLFFTIFSAYYIWKLK